MRRTTPADFWQSVTGSLEIDELPDTAALRELFEETGIRAVTGKSEQGAVTLVDHQCSSLFEINGVWRERYHPDQTHNREHLFSVQLDSPVSIQLNVKEHSESVWLPAVEAIERATSPTNKRAIEDIVLSAQYRQ